MFGSRRFWLDSIGIVVVLVGLTAVTIFSLARWSEPNMRYRGSVRNPGPDGVQSLAEWLNDMGYQLRFPDSTLLPEGNEKILFVFTPEGEFADFDMTTVESWVQGGGTLIMVQDSNRSNDLLQRFGLQVGMLWWRRDEAELRLPTLNWPWVGVVEVATWRRVRVDCARAVVHLGDCDAPLLVSFGFGRGQVYVMSSLYPFSNAGLQNRANAQFVQNLVRVNAQPGSVILFDEVHRDSRSSWLLQSREGWGLLLALLLVVGYGVAQRQRFGGKRPSTQRYEPQLRKTAEFITSVAAVDPTGQHRAVRQHYWQRLKRQLGRRHGLDPAWPDEHFLAEMKPFVDDYELSRLISLLISLREPLISDFDLQEWIRQVLAAGRRD